MASAASGPPDNMSFHPEYNSPTSIFRPTMTSPNAAQYQAQHSQLQRQPPAPYTTGSYLPTFFYSNLPGPSHPSNAPLQQQQYASQPLHPPAQPFTYTQSFSQGYPNVPVGWLPQNQLLNRPLPSSLLAPAAPSISPRQSQAQLSHNQASSSHALYQSLGGSDPGPEGFNGQAGPATANGGAHAGGASAGSSFSASSSGQGASAPAGFDFMHSFGSTNSYPSQPMSDSSYSMGFNSFRPFAPSVSDEPAPAPTPNLLGLPGHLLHHISKDLAAIDILHLSLTCKKLLGTWTAAFWRTWAQQDRKPCPFDVSAVKHFFPGLVSQCEICGGVNSKSTVSAGTQPLLRLCDECWVRFSNHLHYTNKTRAINVHRVKKAVVETLPFISHGPQKLYLIRDLMMAKWAAEGVADQDKHTIQAIGRVFLYSDPAQRGKPTAEGMLTLQFSEDDAAPIQGRTVIPQNDHQSSAKVDRTPSAAAHSPAASVASSTGRRRRSTASSVSAPARRRRAASKSPSEAHVARMSQIEEIMRTTRKQQLIDALDREGFMVTEETDIMRRWIAGEYLVLRAMNIYSVEDLVRHLLDTFWAHHRQRSGQAEASSAAAQAPVSHGHPAPDVDDPPPSKRAKSEPSPPTSPRLANLDEFIDHAHASNGSFKQEPEHSSTVRGPPAQQASSKPCPSQAHNGTDGEGEQDGDGDGDGDGDADDEDEPDASPNGQKVVERHATPSKEVESPNAAPATDEDQKPEESDA